MVNFVNMTSNSTMAPSFFQTLNREEPRVYLTPQQINMMQVLQRNQHQLNAQDLQTLRTLQQKFVQMNHQLKLEQERVEWPV